ADYLNLPFVYVRPEAKKHGRKNQIEGHLEPGSSVIVIEDLISTGKSSLLAVEALKAEGATVKGMLAIFTYGFETATKNFEKAAVTLNTLSDYTHLLEQAADTNYITQDQQSALENWRKDPANWG
ncbi:MAG: orotate phosphoribosyltransferase, partial [Flavobacteriales bacterium]